ncbi:tRNA pseudouridine(38-40) synthase TruA [Atopobiaceae bacterium 24-176]
MGDETNEAMRAGEPGAGTLVLKVGYQGAGFSGFAAQEGQRTVAGELTRALETLLRRPVEMACAGRTDAGVSAISQYVSVPVTQAEWEGLSARRLVWSMTALTPEDISIMGAWRAEAGFSARFDATGRRYRYRIKCGPQPVLLAGHVWWLRDGLDVGAMDRAAQCLVGEHDFKSFCKKSSAEGKRTFRALTECSVSRQTEVGEELVCVDVAGNAFLHNMVRIIVGTLVEVGAKRRPEAWVAEVLEARRREAAGPTAPPEGLTFLEVQYPSSALVTW